MEKPWLKEYDADVPHSIDYPQVPITQFLIDAAAKYPNNTALIFGGVVEPLGNALLDSTMSYGELLTQAQKFAAVLQGLGVEKGDRVAIHLPNCPQFVIAYYGTLLAGGVVVPCNPQYVAREIEHQFNDSGAKVAVTLSLMYPVVKQVRAKTQLEHVIVANIKEYFPGLLRVLFTLAKEKKEGHAQDISGDANTYWFQDLLAQAPDKPQQVEVTPDDTGVLMYTGGTTGVSKGAQLTHRNLVANAIQVRWWMWDNQEGKEVILTSLPLFHSYAMTVCMNLAVYLASAMILIPNPRILEHVLKSINKHKPSLFPGVPALYVSIINYPDIAKYDVSANALRDGWLHTGDIARMDGDGFFQIVDRKKDMILGTGGYNIYPREVEDVLYEHPKVMEVAVAGVPVGKEKGERVKAYVVLKPGETATEEEILDYCRENLAYYKVPKFIEFREELPKSIVGKVLRRVLVEEELKRLQEQA